MRSAFAGMVLLAGCTAPAPSPQRPLRDLQLLAQDARQYAPPGRRDQPLVAASAQQAMLAHLRERFFAPWHRMGPSVPVKTVAAAVERFARGRYCAPNMLPCTTQWYDHMRERLDAANLSTSPYCAIAVRSTSLRHLPTAEPLFESFDKPGGGFPFDMLQETAVYIGTPLLIDYRIPGWAFVESSLGNGWVPIKDLALTSKEFRRDWESRPLAAVIRDTESICKNLPYGVPAPLGTILPLRTDSGGLTEVFVPIAEASFAAKAVTGVADPDDIAILPLAMTPGRLAAVADALLGQTYGWGGLYGNRDCSATTHDLFVPFGLWLPRSSAGQAAAGEVVSLRGLSPGEKERLIFQRGRPWLTLLRSPGHIMLYIGQRDGRGVMLHNFWGVRTRSPYGAEGRHVVGRCVITTLAPGAELPDLLPGSTYLETMESMILLPPTGATTTTPVR